MLYIGAWPSGKAAGSGPATVGSSPTAPAKTYLSGPISFHLQISFKHV